MGAYKQTIEKVPCVSVCMVTYNRVDFLPLAIESVLRQEFSDWEMIIVDDASTDNTKEVVQRYVSKDARIRYYRNDTHKKISDSRNYSLKQSYGEYVAILDSDDVWHDPQKLKKQVTFFQKHPDYVLIGTGVIVIDAYGIEKRRYKNLLLDKDIRANIYACNPFAHSSVMYRRKDVLGIGGYDTTLETAEDYDLFLRLGTVGKFANLNDYLIQYRVHGSNITVTDRFQTMILNVVLVRKYKGIYTGYCRAMIRRLGRLAVYMVLSICHLM